MHNENHCLGMILINVQDTLFRNQLNSHALLKNNPYGVFLQCIGDQDITN